MLRDFFAGKKRQTKSRSSVARCLNSCRLLDHRRLLCEPLEDRRLLNAVYVDDSATGRGNGTSWADAYTDLQAALALTDRPLEIRVAQGTYKLTTGTDRTVSFVLSKNVSIIGGYAGFGAADPDLRDVGLYASILFGDIGTLGDMSDNSYHVVVGSGTDATAVLDGFTITAGNADGSSPNSSGGGMYNSAGSPMVTNCKSTANSAVGGGGGSVGAAEGRPNGQSDNRREYAGPIHEHLLIDIDMGGSTVRL